MTSLIKNQIIKRLSKFVKNLSSNQLNLSTLKGEGELSGINLDETALEEVTELPTWLKIQKATCGRVFIKIPWTSLKTLPIQIQLDDVVIEIETCEKLRDVQTSSSTSGPDPLLGKYGFTNRVIDGISLTVTNLTFQIKAQGFKASILLPSLDIYSTTPDGRQVENLTFTRLRNATKDHILLFKEISWPNARIEASSKDNFIAGTAIRLIVNSCRIRIAMKKNLQDSSMVTSRLMLQFDDLLSVVNDAQLTSALNAYEEITALMKRASQQKKRKAGETLTRLERQAQPSTFQPKAPTVGLNQMNNPYSAYASQEQSKDAFNRYDVVETSLHFNVKRFDLHIIADCESQTDRLVENGSIQMTIANLSLDHYPYHEYGSSKKHWINYNEMQSTNRTEWVNRLHEEWHEQFNTAKASVPSDESSVKLEKALRSNRIRLFESSTVINIDDFVFYPVSLNVDKQHKRRRPLITSDNTYYQLPDSLGIINIQHSEYYYPLPYAFPVPNSDLYIQIMPVVLRLDFATLTWLDAFVSTLSLTIAKSGILKNNQTSQSNFEHIAIHLEAMLPRVVITSDTFSTVQESEKAKQMDQPRSDRLQQNETVNQENLDILELNVSKVLLTNVRIEQSSSRDQLEKHLSFLEKSNFFQQTQWPFSKETSNRRISTVFEKHPYETYLYDNPLSQKTGKLPEPPFANEALHTYYTMTTNSLKKSAKCDIWHYQAENIYLEFTPASSSSSMRLAKQNMIDTLSVTGWAVLDEKQTSSSSSSLCPWVNLLAVLETPSMLKLSQKQYTFIMHLVDELGLFLDVLEQNKLRTHAIKESLSLLGSSSSDPRVTICLTTPTQFTLAVIDGLQETIVLLSTAPPNTVPESSEEPNLRDTSERTTVIELVTGSAPIIAGTAKVSSVNLNKTAPIKKPKYEENLSRGLDSLGLGSSITSSANLSEHSDETASQWDLSEDLDTDFEASLFAGDFESQQRAKASRIELDEETWSLHGKNQLTMTALESANGVFVKLHQINVCITEDESKSDLPFYVACNAKYLRIDEFSALKFDTIKPKLFNQERADELNSEQVPPIKIRIDLLKGESKPPPHLTLQMFDRSLAMNTHAIDILVQNLEEIPNEDDNLVKKDQPKTIVPVDVHLKNLQLNLTLPDQSVTTEAVIESRPPMKVNIERLHLVRQMDGAVIIREATQQNPSEHSVSSSQSNDSLDETVRQSEFLRLENQRLRSELKTHQIEINVLRGERDSLMKTISKLDIELTNAEYQRVSQQQQQSQSPSSSQKPPNRKK